MTVEFSHHLLFVYGTLLRAAHHPMGRFLQANARFLGKGSIRGRLYHCGWFPRAIASGNPRERVHGELFALTCAPRILAQLDRYEVIEPSAMAPAHNERVKVPVRLADGRELMAWVYLTVRDISRQPRIPSGRWLDRR